MNYMEIELIKCPICGTEFDGESLVDECPYCDWIYDYTEGNEFSEVNHMTIKEAKEKLEKGLNIWGDPLPKS